MNREREEKILILESFATLLNILAINLTVEAARVGGDLGRGMAIIAEETRNLTVKLALVRSSGNDDIFYGISDIAFQLKLLSVNASLENAHNNNLWTSEGSNRRSISVLVEEIKSLAAKIIEFTNTKHTRKPYIFPEIISPVKSTAVQDYFFQYSIGGFPFIENTHYIREIHYPDKNDIAGEIYNFRGWQARIVNFYKKFNLKEKEGDRQTIIIISTVGGKSWDNLLAVPIDDLEDYAIFQSQIGCNVPPKAGHAFADYTRECWDVIGDDQLIFLDWEKFI